MVFIFITSPARHRERSRTRTRTIGALKSTPRWFPIISSPRRFPFSALRPLPEIASTRVLHPPLDCEIATDASALSVLSLLLLLSLSFSRSHALTFFSVPSSPIFPWDVSGKGPVGPVRLTRVLFDYYFSTYRALVTSLCGHMVVGGWRVSRETENVTR